MFGKDQSHFPFMTLKINFVAFFISFTKKTYHLEFWGKAYVHNYPHMKIYFQPPPPFPHQVEQNTYSLIWGGGSTYNVCVSSTSQICLAWLANNNIL